MTVARTAKTLAFCLLILACATTARAEVVAATLYPTAALVTETLSLPLAQDGALSTGSLTLPAAAEPGTLSILPAKTSGLRLAGTSVRTVQRRDEGRIRDLVAKLEKETAKRQALADKLSARQAGASFWRAQAGAALDKTAEAKAMALALRDGLAAELAAASGLAREVKAQDKVVAEIKKELDRLTGGAETVHEVTVSLAGKAPKSVELTFTYRLRGAGWEPAYVLDALPAKGQVRFSWDAMVRQNSGRPWNNVALSLATAEFRSGANPPYLQPWDIRPAGPPVMLRKKAANAEMMMAPAAMAEEDMGGYATRTQGAVFDTYEAGRVTLASGDRKRLSIGRETWKADFAHLVRPYAEPRAYLRAKIALDKAPRIPAGPADFLLEGALVQKLHFTLNEREAELFFGADPQVAVTFRSGDRKSGESGLFGGKNKHLWSWTVEVENGKPAAANILVEDRLPRPGDERIKIEKDLPGAKEEKDGRAVWEFPLAPGAKKSLKYGYEITWPGDMDLDLGGR